MRTPLSPRYCLMISRRTLTATTCSGISTSSSSFWMIAVLSTWKCKSKAISNLACNFQWQRIINQPLTTRSRSSSKTKRTSVYHVIPNLRGSSGAWRSLMSSDSLTTRLSSTSWLPASTTMRRHPTSPAWWIPVQAMIASSESWTSKMAGPKSKKRRHPAAPRNGKEIYRKSTNWLKRKGIVKTCEDERQARSVDWKISRWVVEIVREASARD